MLKKLYKYDWKSVSLLLMILHGILLIYTLIGRIGLGIGMAKFSDGTVAANPILGIAGGLYFMIYMFFIFAVLIITIVYLAIRIQKSLFSDEGYLTHTLPVTPGKLLWSKLFIYWTWVIIDLVCVGASLLLLFSTKETLPLIREIFSNIFRLFDGSMGTDGQIIAILTLFSAIAQYFGYYSTLLLFSMCLGNLFKTHKILGSVISFCGIHMALSIIAALFAFLFQPSIFTNSQSSAFLPGINIMAFLLIWTTTLAVFFFLGSRHILSKKLNLE